MPSIQQFDTTMHLLHKVLDLRAKNQEVIAANIANAETPTSVLAGGVRPAKNGARACPMIERSSGR